MADPLLSVWSIGSVADAPSIGGFDPMLSAWWYTGSSGGPPPPTYDSLPEAILAWWDTRPELVAAFPGGLWRDETPPEEVFPYATFSILGGPTDYFTGGWRQALEAGQVWFNAYAYTARESDLLARLIRDAFQDADLRLADQTVMAFRRTGYPSALLTPEKGPGSRDVWQSVSQFDFMLGPAYTLGA